MGLFKKVLGVKEESKVEIDHMIYSPIAGKVVPLSEVNDQVFAQEMMGKGIAVFPTTGRVVAPCNGEVISVFKTLHAVTIKADNGAEIIIHVGLETVALDGQYFKKYVEDGQRIKKGDLLLTFDVDKISEGYDVTTPVIVTNPTDFQSVKATEEGEVDCEDSLIDLGGLKT